MAKYYSMATNKGLSLYTNAGLTGKKVNITEFTAGDGNGNYYQPEPSMTALKHEVWRGAVTEYVLDTESDHIVNVYGVIPAQVGGFTIREIAAFDDAKNMILISNTPDIFKATIEDGISSDMELCISVIMEHPEFGESKVDLDTVIVSRRYLEKVTGTPKGPASYEQGVTAAERIAISTNTNARHTHGNKSILDTISQAVLDKWNTAYSHISDAVKHITSGERTAWNGKADKSYVDAEMQNKANGAGYTASHPLSSAIGSGFYRFDTPSDIPPGAGFEYGQMMMSDVLGTKAQLVFGFGKNVAAFRTARADGTYLDFTQIATVTPPQEFNLPLSIGYTPNSFCYVIKTQENLVIFGGGINLPDNHTDGAVIATLPVGFRPQKTYDYPATAQSGVARSSVSIAIYVDGTIKCHGAISAGSPKRVFIQGVFVSTM